MHYVLHRVLCGQHEHRSRDAFRAQAFCQVITAQLGHHDVEDDHVELVVHRQFQASNSVRGAFHGMPLLPKTFGEKFNHSLFIFDDQEVHGNTGEMERFRTPYMLGRKCEYSMKTPAETGRI